ncbi:MAG: hypothetical protein IT495_16190 [Gammaproteobacteria bacterium]|nr:hypothetical protein [Gammaproteobacteria bacterium]
MRPWLFLLALLGLVAATAGAAPLERAQVPAPLRPWVDWVLRDAPGHGCPFAYQDYASRTCVWPGTVTLDLGERGGRFGVVARVYERGWLSLPGDAAHWPQEVTANGQPLAVLPRDGRPAADLEPGQYRIEGKFAWQRMPESLSLASGTGLVHLSIRGESVAFPDVNERGQLWLKRREPDAAAAGEADALGVQVYRRIVDGVPVRIVTDIELKVSGRAREIILGPVLLDDTMAISLSAPLPAQLGEDGRLRVQVRPGQWHVIVTARTLADRTGFTLPAVPAPWPDEELWAFEASTQVRLAQVHGVTPIDPRQTTVPQEWVNLPAYQIHAGDTLTLEVIRRGDPEPEPDKLSLSRRLWLDFDGGGYTVNDRILGSMSRSWRLEAGDALALGRVLLNGEPQLVTTRTGSDRRGVEVRRGALDVSADSRWEGGVRELPAVGWDHDVQHLETVLNLPPGWTLFSAGGVDKVSDAWLERWTLLDLFLVLIATLAVARLWDWRWGLVAAATLALVWHEAGAPRQIWLHLLAAVALLRVLPPGRIRVAVGLYRNAGLVVLAAVAIPFIVATVRTGLYPQLEQPWQAVARGEPAMEVAGMAAPARTPAAKMRAGEPVMADAQLAPQANEAVAVSPGAAGVPASAVRTARVLAAVDPEARLQTGPGLPRWSWHEVTLRWNGPVERDQLVRLRLLSPGLNLVLDGVRVLLVFTFAGLLMASARPRSSTPGGAVPAATVLLALLVGVTMFAPRDTRAAAFPDPPLLEELRTRLTEPPDCVPACAAIARMQLDAQADLLMLRLDVVAAAAIALPLPGGAQRWLPTDVSVDAAPAQDRLRRDGERLWLQIDAGQHQVILLGRLPAHGSVDLPLPLRPYHVEVMAKQWTVEGVRENGVPEAQLRLTRDSGPAPAVDHDIPVLEATPLPAFVRVERVLHLGLDWTVTTTVQRLSPAGSAVIVAVPLLDGESVTTPDTQISDGKVQVNVPPGARGATWESVLARRDTIELEAPDTTAWSEIWRVDVAPIWHIDTQGLAVVHHQSPAGERQPEWRPWPGEAVTLTVTRPAGAPGPTLTIDESHLAVQPGKRATDVTLELRLRSSQGGQHTITLPADARLQAVTIDALAQPIRQEGSTVTVPLKPAAQQVQIQWRSPAGIRTRFVTPAVSLGSPSVNAGIDLTLGEDRWVLMTHGPRLGPAVLFWGVLIAIAGVALGLGRVRLTPLDATAWFLLAVGLSQVDIWSAIVVVVWLFALGARARLGETTRNDVFNLTQLLLPVLTLAALVILFQAIRQGLLGQPDMQIAGNGSSAWSLHWYQDRSDAALPQASVLSVPLVVYRLLMLAWALWLAAALLRWLRWGWSCYSSGGLWRPVRRRRDGAPAPDTPAAG